jgi:hypothetical protein
VDNWDASTVPLSPHNRLLQLADKLTAVGVLKACRELVGAHQRHKHRNAQQAADHNDTDQGCPANDVAQLLHYEDWLVKQLRCYAFCVHQGLLGVQIPGRQQDTNKQNSTAAVSSASGNDMLASNAVLCSCNINSAASVVTLRRNCSSM